MCVAMIQPKQQGKKGTSLLSKEVSSGFVSRARTVLSVLPELAAQVLDGATTLNKAKRAFDQRRERALFKIDSGAANCNNKRRDEETGADDSRAVHVNRAGRRLQDD